MSGGRIGAGRRRAVEGLALEAAHADGAAVAGWEIAAQTGASIAADLFELGEPQDSAAQTPRIKADANLASIAAPSVIALNASVRAAYGETGEDFDAYVSSGIRLRIGVCLEGALEQGAGAPFSR